MALQFEFTPSGGRHNVLDRTTPLVRMNDTTSNLQEIERALDIAQVRVNRRNSVSQQRRST
jgi:hypothetical protein